MLFIALTATFCGAKNCVDIADFAVANERALAEIVDLPHGGSAKGVIAIDGKNCDAAMSAAAPSCRR